MRFELVMKLVGMPLRVAIARTSKCARTVCSAGIGQITRATPFLGDSLALAIPKYEACATYFLIA